MLEGHKALVDGVVDVGCGHQMAELGRVLYCRSMEVEGCHGEGQIVEKMEEGGIELDGFWSGAT